MARSPDDLYGIRSPNHPTVKQLRIWRLKIEFARLYKPRPPFLEVSPELRYSIREAMNRSQLDQKAWAYCCDLAPSTITKILHCFHSISTDTHSKLRALIKATRKVHGGN